MAPEVGTPYNPADHSAPFRVLPEEVFGHIDLQTLIDIHRYLRESENQDDQDLATWIKDNYLYEPINESGRMIRTTEGFSQLDRAYRRVRSLTNKAQDKWPFFDRNWKTMSSATVRNNARGEAAPGVLYPSANGDAQHSNKATQLSNVSPAPEVALQVSSHTDKLTRHSAMPPGDSSRSLQQTPELLPAKDGQAIEPEIEAEQGSKSPLQTDAESGSEQSSLRSLGSFLDYTDDDSPIDFSDFMSSIEDDFLSDTDSCSQATDVVLGEGVEAPMNGQEGSEAEAGAAEEPQDMAISAKGKAREGQDPRKSMAFKKKVGPRAIGATRNSAEKTPDHKEVSASPELSNDMLNDIDHDESVFAAVQTPSASEGEPDPAAVVLEADSPVQTPPQATLRVHFSDDVSPDSAQANLLAVEAEAVPSNLDRLPPSSHKRLAKRKNGHSPVGQRKRGRLGGAIGRPRTSLLDAEKPSSDANGATIQNDSQSSASFDVPKDEKLDPPRIATRRSTRRSVLADVLHGSKDETSKEQAQTTALEKNGAKDDCNELTGPQNIAGDADGDTSMMDVGPSMIANQDTNSVQEVYTANSDRTLRRSFRASTLLKEQDRSSSSIRDEAISPRKSRDKVAGTNKPSTDPPSTRATVPSGRKGQDTHLSEDVDINSTQSLADSATATPPGSGKSKSKALGKNSTSAKKKSGSSSRKPTPLRNSQVSDSELLTLGLSKTGPPEAPTPQSTGSAVSTCTTQTDGNDQRADESKSMEIEASPADIVKDTNGVVAEHTPALEPGRIEYLAKVHTATGIVEVPLAPTDIDNEEAKLIEKYAEWHAKSSSTSLPFEQFRSIFQFAQRK
ncbi:hypothetical protein ACN47E_007177 [Coniothyrium glycines]